MAFLDEIGGLLQQYTHGGDVTPEQARSDYDRIASTVPGHVLGSVIGPALSSLGRDQVQERIYNSASEMTPGVRGQFFETLLNSIGGSGGNVSSILTQPGVNPGLMNRPQEASPDDVAKIAAHAQQAHPDAFNQAMSFYKQHPTLVKVLGTMAIAKIAQQLSGTPQPSR